VFVACKINQTPFNPKENQTMNSITKLAATLAIATTLTLTACDEKKNQDGTTTTVTEPAAEAATQEATAAVAEKPAENAGGSTLTDTRDNKTYKTVKIGTQVWMAENLNFEAKGSKCYENKPDNCQKYGRLYNWETAMKACPSGWKLPSKDEWKPLEDFAGGYQIAGKKLKAKSGWNNYTSCVEEECYGEDEGCECKKYVNESGNGTDDYGFSALPSGDGGSDGSFGGSDSGSWWSATENDFGGVYKLWIQNEYTNIFGNFAYKSSLYSVRCIKD
jgi:uncharacterized protein (TIGR02145 family)